MDGFAHGSDKALAAAPRAPGAWRTMQRDWRNWSRAERIAAELILGFSASATVLALALKTLA